jgi:hypothetical protein
LGERLNRTQEVIGSIPFSSTTFKRQKAESRVLSAFFVFIRWSGGMPTERRTDPDAEIDALFRLPLAEFTSARNALAARFRKSGRTIDAERVKSLAKAPAPAWAVNQLYWRSPKAIEQLIGVTERVRKAQTGRSRTPMSATC